MGLNNYLLTLLRDNSLIKYDSMEAEYADNSNGHLEEIIAGLGKYFSVQNIF